MAKFGVGASVTRKEDDRFLRGKGQYVGDFRIAGMREVAFVRSPVAHAHLKGINIPSQFRVRSPRISRGARALHMMTAAAPALSSVRATTRAAVRAQPARLSTLCATLAAAKRRSS